MVVIHSTVQPEFSRPSFNDSQKLNSLNDLKSMAVDEKQDHHASSYETSTQHETDRIRRLKITVLSLSGISVRPFDCSLQTKSHFPNKTFSISASVSFSGSCDPNDMRVASSNLCSATGLLSVESRPVIVPDGMSDRLVAVWDESIPSNVNHDLGGLSAIDSVLIGKQKGAISAIPKASPHLYVVIREEIPDDSFSNRGANAGSTAMSTHSIESSTEDSSDEKQPSDHIEELDYGKTSTSDFNICSSPEIELKGGNTSGAMGNDNDVQKSSSQELTFTILNTPSTDKKSAVPEILEMKISLLANQISSHSFDDGDEDANFVTSIYSPSAEGNEAVAHLVLFPDILDDPLTDKNSDGRIIQIPVRKSIHPISKSFESRSSTKLLDDKDATWRRFLGDPKVSIDLDDSSMLWIKVERCSERDERIFDLMNLNEMADDPPLVNMKEPDCPQQFETVLSPVTATNHLPTSNDSMVGQGDDASISSNIGTANPKQNTPVAKTSLKKDNSPSFLCSPSFTLDGLLRSFNGMMMHCGDDVRAFQMDDASMDSTIGSNGTL